MKKHDYSLNLVFSPRGLFILIGNLTILSDDYVILYLFYIIHHNDDPVFHAVLPVICSFHMFHVSQKHLILLFLLSFI